MFGSKLTWYADFSKDGKLCIYKSKGATTTKKEFSLENVKAYIEILSRM